MNVKAAAAIAAVVLLCSPVLLFADGASAVYVDPNYRDPPDADTKLSLVGLPTFQSNQSAFVIEWARNVEDNSLIGDYASDSDAAVDLVQRLYQARSDSVATSKYVLEGWDGGENFATSYCLPSWITVDVSAESPEMSISIRPALQQVQEDTTGNYWIYWSVVHDGLVDSRYTYLLEFTVNVDWAGGVVVPEEYNTFQLDFDTRGGSYVPPMYAEVDSNQDSYEFDISGVLDPVRTDYRFLGWTSDVEEGSYLPDEVTVSISDGGSSGSRTIYAMWEYDPQEIVIPTLWDGLIELFSNPVIFLLGVVVFLGVCLFIRNRMRGY